MNNYIFLSSASQNKARNRVKATAYHYLYIKEYYRHNHMICIFNLVLLNNCNNKLAPHKISPKI